MRRATADGLRVRVVGAGHSFTPIARTDDVLVSLDGLTGIEAVDDASGRVRVRAGTRLFDLNPRLDARGLAMPNLGDIAYSRWPAPSQHQPTALASASSRSLRG